MRFFLFIRPPPKLFFVGLKLFDIWEVLKFDLIGTTTAWFALWASSSPQRIGVLSHKLNAQTDRLVSLKSKKLKVKRKNCGFGLWPRLIYCFLFIVVTWYITITYVNIETKFGQFE